MYKDRNTITIAVIFGIFLLSSIIFINTISAAPVCIPFNDYQLGGTAFDLDEDGNQTHHISNKRYRT